jgi:hypothetical protein
MKLFLTMFLLLISSAVIAQKVTVTGMTLAKPTITVIVLHNKRGIPEGWIDSTTRPDATDICNKLIETQSKQYANAISRSRCILQVQE